MSCDHPCRVCGTPRDKLGSLGCVLAVIVCALAWAIFGIVELQRVTANLTPATSSTPKAGAK